MTPVRKSILDDADENLGRHSQCVLFGTGENYSDPALLGRLRLE